MGIDNPINWLVWRFNSSRCADYRFGLVGIIFFGIAEFLSGSEDMRSLKE